MIWVGHPLHFKDKPQTKPGPVTSCYWAADFGLVFGGAVESVAAGGKVSARTNSKTIPRPRLAATSPNSAGAKGSPGPVGNSER